MARAAADERPAWTDAGKAALAEEYARGVAIVREPDAVVHTQVAALVKTYAPAWKRGIAKSDAVGKAAIAFAMKYKPGAKATPEQLGGLVSLVSGNGDDVHGPVIELIVRTYGFEVAFRALVAVWRQRSTYDTKGGLATWIVAMPDDDPHIHDSSAASGKWDFTAYLARRHREGTAADRVAMKQAVDALWKAAPPQAKVAFAVATNDPERAAQIAKELLANDEPHAFFAWQELPHVLADAELVDATLGRRDEGLSYRIVANLGLAALPLFEARMSERISKHWRARILGMLANLRSTTTARILAEYAEEKPYTDVVRSYFRMHPDHLELVLADGELRHYHPELVAMKAAL